MQSKTIAQNKQQIEPTTAQIEQITYDLSQQTLTLKHAFAIEQLNSSPNKNGTNDAQNVSQVKY